MKSKNEIIYEVRKEVEEKVKQYMTEEEFGYENEVYLKMKEKLVELGIDWSPFESDIIQ